MPPAGGLLRALGGTPPPALQVPRTCRWPPAASRPAPGRSHTPPVPPCRPLPPARGQAGPRGQHTARTSRPPSRAVPPAAAGAGPGPRLPDTQESCVPPRSRTRLARGGQTTVTTTWMPPLWDPRGPDTLPTRAPQSPESCSCRAPLPPLPPRPAPAPGRNCFTSTRLLWEELNRSTVTLKGQKDRAQCHLTPAGPIPSSPELGPVLRWGD